MTRKMRLAVRTFVRMRVSTLDARSDLWDRQSTWRTESNFFVQTVSLLYFTIMNVPDLRYIVKTTIVKYLVCSNDISRDHLVMLEYFRSCGQGVFGDEILSQIIGDFPSQLTDELLIVLSPPHQRHLKLTKCSALSCSGLQMAITK